MKKFVAYYRVSTQKQGNSGLGLNAQKTTVQQFIGANNLIAEYTEIESGKNDKRIELNNAIEYAKNYDATLIIAKLDRLSRNITFIFQLRDSKVDFICCDIPDANTMTIGIFALLAQQERELISERTKKALKSKKQLGFKLGKPENLTNSARLKGLAIRKYNAISNNNNRKSIALVNALNNNGVSLRNICKQLNDAGFQTSRGKLFHPTSVKRLINRVETGLL